MCQDVLLNVLPDRLRDLCPQVLERCVGIARLFEISQLHGVSGSAPIHSASTGAAHASSVNFIFDSVWRAIVVQWI
jgi:hypothetical protein